MKLPSLRGAFALLVLTSAVALAEPPSEGVRSEALLEALVGPMDEALAAGGTRAVALRAVVPADAAFLDAVGNFLDARGYQIHSLAAGDDPPVDSAVLELELEVAGFDYPARRRGFLGLGRPKVLRRAVLGARGRIEDTADGRWIWNGAPRLVHQEWIRGGDVDGLANDRPEWMEERGLAPAETRSVWWERGLVAGLVTGIVLIYADGTN